jgi:hypothetical protein
LLRSRIEPAADGVFQRPEPRQLAVEVLRSIAQLARDPAQLLRKVAAGVGRRAAGRQAGGGLFQSASLLFGCLALLLTKSEHALLGIRQQDGRNQKEGSDGERRPGSAWCARPERTVVGRSEHAQRIVALHPDQSAIALVIGHSGARSVLARSLGGTQVRVALGERQCR